MYCEYHSLARRIQALDLGDYLEFGCGDGTFLKYVLSQNNSFRSVTAVDINPESVQKARENLTEWEVRFIVQEKLPLPLEGDQFSTITLSNTLHHLRDKDAVLSELKRLIKPDGRIIITEMISNDISQAEQTYCDFHAWRAAMDQLKGVYHDPTYTSDEILSLITEQGLTIGKKEILKNDKIPEIDEHEISQIETIIDDLVQDVSQRPEFLEFEKRAWSIKENLRHFGIKRPRQLYLEITP
ncbi:MAG: class I SAM-dependent methyltransferase [Candidatus Marinimicrobia bacterium]|nr:class I SAM-dependent methyltransferase [Candidatus Neomarinimicrobiota bacterium]